MTTKIGSQQKPSPEDYRRREDQYLCIETQLCLYLYQVKLSGVRVELDEVEAVLGGSNIALHAAAIILPTQDDETATADSGTLLYM